MTPQVDHFLALAWNRDLLLVFVLFLFGLILPRPSPYPRRVDKNPVYPGLAILFSEKMLSNRQGTGKKGVRGPRCRYHRLLDLRDPESVPSQGWVSHLPCGLPLVSGSWNRRVVVL